MQRWHLTLGLGVVAAAAAMLAPQLFGKTGILSGTSTPTPVPPPDEPTPGHLQLSAELDRTAALIGEPSERFLVIEVTAPANLDDAPSRDLDLSVVLDVSGSMQFENKIHHAREAAVSLASQLRPGDLFSLTTFSDRARVVLSPRHIEGVEGVARVIRSLPADGGTNLYEGLALGADQAVAGRGETRVGRVVLISDGQPTEGVQDAGTIAQLAAHYAEQGLAVTTVGVGLDFNEDLLERVADFGGGNYYYVNDPTKMGEVFAQELSRSTTVIARSTRVDIAVPSGLQVQEVLGWETIPTENGVSLYLGDLYAGQTKKLVARVGVSGDESAAGDLRVSLAYDDLIENSWVNAEKLATLTRTTDHGEVAASANEDASKTAFNAWGGTVLKGSADAYKRGDVAEATRQVEVGRRILAEAEEVWGKDAFEDNRKALDDNDYVYRTAPPSSEAAKHAVKAGKEMSRGWTH